MFFRRLLFPVSKFSFPRFCGERETLCLLREQRTLVVMIHRLTLLPALSFNSCFSSKLHFRTGLEDSYTWASSTSIQDSSYSLAILNVGLFFLEFLFFLFSVTFYFLGSFSKQIHNRQNFCILFSPLQSINQSIYLLFSDLETRLRVEISFQRVDN